MPYTPRNVRSIRKEELSAFLLSVQRQLFSKQGLEYARYLVKVLKDYPKMFAEAVRLAIMGYHLEKTTRHTIAVEDFRNFLALEMDTFKEKISQFTQTQEDRMSEVQSYSRQLFVRVKKEYDSIHEDFRYAAYNALAGFQKSVFKEYLDAELNAFKATVSTFAKAQTERLGELQTYVHDLFTRVRAQHEQLHDDLKLNVQETFDAFRDSVQRHLEQLFGSVPVQIEELN